ncbi:hypothetical protein Nepgr_020426 [Nepenthes gracilis]|uniref:Uncharacterized protein n=1 Tax=Nepenthes gracilis TaxID=150966 RepID=A0AAD3XW96_NEPGR|nr:hypothetical protein Nepgr_020426 [Nepenthes gracilis]
MLGVALLLEDDAGNAETGAWWLAMLDSWPSGFCYSEDRGLHRPSTEMVLSRDVAGSKQPNTVSHCSKGGREEIGRARRHGPVIQPFHLHAKPNKDTPMLTKDMVPTSKVALTTSYVNNTPIQRLLHRDHPKPCIHENKGNPPNHTAMQKRQHGLNS